MPSKTLLHVACEPSVEPVAGFPRTPSVPRHNPNLRGLPAPDVSSLPFSILFHYFKGNIPQESQFPPGHENGNTHHLARLRWIWCSCVQRPWGSGKSRGSLIFFLFSSISSLSKIHQNACSDRCGDIARAQQVDDGQHGQHGQFVFVTCR